MADAQTQPEPPGYADPPPFSCEAQGQSLTFYPAGEDRRQALLDLVASAQKTLDVCFYIFSEDGISTALRDALCEAAGRGVDVTLIIDRFGASAGDEFLKPLVEGGGRYLFADIEGMGNDICGNYQLGAGSLFFKSSQQPISFEIRYDHISNGSTAEPKDEAPQLHGTRPLDGRYQV